MPARPARCLHHIVREVAARDPDALAVVSGPVAWTYRELLSRAHRIAHALRARGVERGTRVGLLAPRSAEAIAAMLGILAAGGAYVPLDPAHPPARLAALADDATLAHAVTTEALRARLPARIARALSVDADADELEAASGAAPAVASDPEDVAYVMYTSGSTGTPKGVEIPHRAIPRVALDPGYVEVRAGDGVLHAAPLAFDASTFEIWTALLHGARLVVHDELVPSARGLGACLRAHGVTVAWLTAALFASVVDEDVRELAALRQLVVGGEALPLAQVRRALDAHPALRLVNGYGPTETTTFATCHVIERPLDPAARSVPIGTPIRETRVVVVDAAGAPVPRGEVGELLVGGAGLARGYLRDPERTAARFVVDPDRPGERLYRTGDRVRMRHDGVLEILGRADDQVKIRGHRVELAEVEATLGTHPGLARCAVVALGDGGDRRLAAYVVPRDHARPPSLAELRAHVAAALPDAMVPSAFVPLAELPLSPTGKVDRARLPAPPRARPALAGPAAPLRGETERRVAAAFREVLGIDEVGARDGFFALGGDSLRALRALAWLRDAHGLDVPASALFEDDTVEALARRIDSAAPARARVAAPARRADEPIAIVGMAVRLPGAPDVETFWRNLCDGVDAITSFAPGAIDPEVPAELRGDPRYVRARGVLADADRFDAAFFGLSPAEATALDPQQRVLLEVTWEALENAGWVPAAFAGRIGVFAGKYNDTYAPRLRAARPDLVASLGDFQAMLASEKDYVATRIAHQLDLTGPAVSVHTACSTSLVAVCLAAESLRSGDCDLALAGGVAVTVPMASGHLHQEGGMLSDDGRTRPFDAAARGTVFSDGAGVVVLRRLSDALRDGDRVRAVIRGFAVNNDGARRASFTAPSVEGQAAVVAAAQDAAGVDPRSIGFVEAHGTATPLGDPIEVAALTRVFRRTTDDVGFCALGSAKGNVGHTVIAAGAAGLVKAALAVESGRVPPTAHFREPNPALALSTTPFFVNDRAIAWPRLEGPRRAGVSSFGVGGTNAHVVIEEPPIAPRTAPPDGPVVLPVSARTRTALEASAARLADWLESHGDGSLADVALTLRTGRAHLSHRLAVVAASREEAVRALRAPRASGVAREAFARARVGFLFPGQGAQHAGMASGPYAHDAGFRADVDRCAELLAPRLGLDLRAPLLEVDARHDERLRETRLAQPALLVTSWALARLWQRIGVAPAVLVGHSVGELAAATLAGVLDLEDALALVADRGELLQAVAPGAMLSVRAEAASIARRIGPEVAIAAENAPDVTVVAGPTSAIEALEVALAAEGIATRRLHTSHAFHSPMVDAVVAPFHARVARVSLRAPAIAIVSTRTGAPLTAAEASDPAYWASHVRDTVRFGAAVRSVAEPETVLIDLGSRGTLASLVRMQVAPERTSIFASIEGGATGDAAWRSLLEATARAWAAGVEVDLGALGPAGAARRVPLPTYPFERRRYWYDAPGRTAAEPSRPAPSRTLPLSRSPSMDRPRRERLVATILEVVRDATGLDVALPEPTFVELGLDSLFLTQIALTLSKRLGATLSFRDLVDRHPSPAALAAHLDATLPAEAAPPPTVVNAAPAMGGLADTATLTPADLQVPEVVRDLIDRQLRLMEHQLALLGGRATGAPLPAPPIAPPPASVATPPTAAGLVHAPAVAPPASAAAEAPAYDAKRTFGAIARIQTQRTDDLAPRQRARLEAFVRRYTAKTGASKRHAEQHRAHHADPRAVTGFRPLTKELVYPIVVERSAGARVWDLDGNEYVDVLNGFGCNLFGWQPEFVARALHAQIDRGYEVGPQHPLAGETAELVCAMTASDRAAFCNTGSEAVLGAVRIARTSTGRKKIAIFAGSYHGVVDEVIVRGTKTLRSVPAAPGIMPESSQNVLVLEYGTPEALETIRSLRSELAAVVVEPVQSRRPDLQPREFLHALRALTAEAGIVLVFDEVITGFRVAPGGAQEHFGVRADLATYGKVIGGGLPIGLIAGKRELMDALDGGAWRFGDDSVPTVGVTYFAGTFVRHPLALAAANAVVRHLAERGPSLQRELTERTTALATRLNRALREAGAPAEIRHFGSLWKTFFTGDQPFGDLFFYLLRDRGLHVWEAFPCFLTTAHADAEVDRIATAFAEATREMQESDWFPRPPASSLDAGSPPVAGARLGRDPLGNPAWFVADPEHPGRWLRVQEGR